METSKDGGRAGFGAAARIVAGLWLAALALAYAGLHGKYRPENTDDAWFLSAARHHVADGIEGDPDYGSEPGAGGYGGVAFFGKTYSLLYGRVLEAAGWTKSRAHLLSTFCMVLAAACWAGLLVKLRFGRPLALFFALALLLTEPGFGAANQARPDALSFLAVSAALLLFAHGRYIAAGLLAGVALEIHPVGVVVFPLMAALALTRQAGFEQGRPEWRRALPGLALGLAAGAAWYALLHAASLARLPAMLLQGNTTVGGEGNILYEYFVKTKYLRHLPELAAFAAAAVFLAVRGPVREKPVVPALFLAAVLFALLVRRPNFMYMVYLYPAFLLLPAWLFDRHGRLPLFAGLLLAYLIPQYGFVYLKNRHWDMDAYVARVRQAVPPDGTPVMGMPNDWFAFVGRPFYRADYQGDFAAVAPERLVLVESEPFRDGAFPRVKAVTDRLYDASELGRFENRGETVIVKSLVKR